MKMARGSDDKLTSACDGLASLSDDDDTIEFISVNENDISTMIMTKKSHHKCTYETKLKRRLNAHESRMTT